jgi:hypothetical protein
MLVSAVYILVQYSFCSIPLLARCKGQGHNIKPLTLISISPSHGAPCSQKKQDYGNSHDDIKIAFGVKRNSTTKIKV